MKRDPDYVMYSAIGFGAFVIVVCAALKQIAAWLK